MIDSAGRVRRAMVRRQRWNSLCDKIFRSEGRRVARWALISAVSAPVILLVAATLARLVHKVGYDPIAQTMSVLAGHGRSEWIMTTGFALSSLCQVITAAGLYAVRRSARVGLAFAGVCGLAIAANPVTVDRTVHQTLAGFGAFALAIWPLLTMSREPDMPTICRPRWAVTASVLMISMLIWTGYEMWLGPMVGLAERVATVAELGWPVAVSVAVARPPVNARRSGRGADRPRATQP